MLVLSRKVGEELIIGDNIRIVVNRLDASRVSLAIEAPRSVSVMRGELKEAHDAFRVESSETGGTGSSASVPSASVPSASVPSASVPSASFPSATGSPQGKPSRTGGKGLGRRLPTGSLRTITSTSDPRATDHRRDESDAPPSLGGPVGGTASINPVLLHAVGA